MTHAHYEPLTSIAGVVDWRSPVSAETITAMLMAMDPGGGSDKINRATDHSALGSLVFNEMSFDDAVNNTSGPKASHHPSGDVIVADAAIYNREELLKRLSQSLGLKPVTSDSQLLLESYHRWGVEFPKYVIGDFAFAIWDNAAKALLLGRDHVGLRPLFIHHQGTRIVFASEAKAILAHPEVDKKLDLQMLAQLATGQTGSAWVDSDRSFFEAVRSTPPAAVMRLTARATTIHPYWHSPQEPDLEGRSDGAILEEYREIVHRAVCSRIPGEGTALSLLSGGLDSSVIVSVAGDHLANCNRKLETLTSVPETGDVHADDCEWEFASAFEGHPGVVMSRVSAPGAGPFDDFDAVVTAYEAPTLIRTHYLYSAFAKEALARGGNIILDGVGGEYGPTYSATGFYTQLLAKGRWSTLCRELTERKRVYGQPWLSLLKQQLLLPLRASGAKASMPVWGQVVRHETLPEPQLSAPDLWNRFDVQQQHRMTVQRVPKRSRVAGYKGCHRVRHRYPLMDPTLIDFCLRVPLRLKLRHGYMRNLAREGGVKSLPDKIRWRTSKAPFSPDFHLRYRRQRSIALDCFSQVKPNDPLQELLKIDQLRSAAQVDLTRSVKAKRGELAAMQMTFVGMSLITFLRQFKELRL